MTSIRKWIERWLAADGKRRDEIWIEVSCGRCGEAVRARVNLNNDLSLLDKGVHERAQYFCRKVLVGQSGCYQRIEVELYFDTQRNLVEKKVLGGQFTEV